MHLLHSQSSAKRVNSYYKIDFRKRVRRRELEERAFLCLGHFGNFIGHVLGYFCNKGHFRHLLVGHFVAECAVSMLNFCIIEGGGVHL